MQPVLTTPIRVLCTSKTKRLLAVLTFQVSWYGSHSDTYHFVSPLTCLGFHARIWNLVGPHSSLSLHCGHSP
ncbi:hypothetical protein HD554DRAFT_1748598 [Boletus coccyginus]|nr:hypothetical protein HD554DRAFT_1748598 [Boletus coccyginus]